MIKRIKYFALVFIVAITLVWLLGTVPLNDEEGLYNPITDLIWCSNESSCLHELGHKLDRHAGWISHSERFGSAVEMYVFIEIYSESPPSRLVHRILSLPGTLRRSGITADPQAEMYATIFELSDGKVENMPEIFREFYDWDRVEIYLKILQEQGK